ncbi:hypothetical protein [Novosphingobium sp. KN65.2]|uniref:hypothetical protein n=1 Tax=Novosphingobium sp. KN65.2 TaxID=1478134 RepID=UPI0005E1309C|nr:hypothetical protein [Novosphingobium sp. KN65.2]CDO37280.1 exported hypothetical protein [Novosphingobium sp. KN65.2]
MTVFWVVLIVVVSVAASAFGYWRALRLHLRIVDIDPQFRGLVTHVLDFLSHRKD